MSPAALAILAIIDKALAITLEIIKDMPPDQKQAYWERREKVHEFWQGVFEKLNLQP